MHLSLTNYLFKIYLAKYMLKSPEKFASLELPWAFLLNGDLFEFTHSTLKLGSYQFDLQFKVFVPLCPANNLGWEVRRRVKKPLLSHS